LTQGSMERSSAASGFCCCISSSLRSGAAAACACSSSQQGPEAGAGVGGLAGSLRGSQHGCQPPASCIGPARLRPNPRPRSPPAQPPTCNCSASTRISASRAAMSCPPAAAQGQSGKGKGHRVGGRREGGVRASKHEHSRRSKHIDSSSSSGTKLQPQQNRREHTGSPPAMPWISSGGRRATVSLKSCSRRWAYWFSGEAGKA
jgi:hypothetical protein